MMKLSEEALWEIDAGGDQIIRCESESILSAVAKALVLKAEHQLSQRCFDGIMANMRSSLPKTAKMPENFYQAKKMVKPLMMPSRKYDVCPNFCMLYYKDRENKDRCDECNEPRYETVSHNQKSKQIARKVLHYLPIGPRLQRLYMTRSNARHMRWHKEGVRDKPNLMVHPADAPAWRTFDEQHPQFASEIRNVRLGLSTDGFTAYSPNAAPYSCWPLFVFPYNLPPELLMKEDTMFLALVIPGSKHPGRDIDICLEPLIDELNALWKDGIETYDVFKKENFCIKACLLWTVSDFPAYEMLSGWGTHGRMCCPYCMGDTKSFWLANGAKACWFDATRSFLPPEHEFRRDKKNFFKNRVETDPPPPILTGAEIKQRVDALDPIRWGRNAPLSQLEGYGKTHHWQKKSIFWKLPYW